MQPALVDVRAGQRVRDWLGWPAEPVSSFSVFNLNSLLLTSVAETAQQASLVLPRRTMALAPTSDEEEAAFELLLGGVQAGGKVACSLPSCTSPQLEPGPERIVRLRCGRCHAAFYCDTACQRAHYPEHKPDCLAKAAARVAAHSGASGAAILAAAIASTTASSTRSGKRCPAPPLEVSAHERAFNLLSLSFDGAHLFFAAMCWLWDTPALLLELDGAGGLSQRPLAWVATPWRFALMEPYEEAHALAARLRARRLDELITIADNKRATPNSILII